MNALAAKVMSAFTKACGSRRIRVLEVGAGTGSTTQSILPVLAPVVSEYWFTDIGPLFLRRAEATFADQDFMRFAPFDIDQPADAQGFAPGSFDVIVAANVVHNADDLIRTLGQLQKLLRPGGLLMLREIAEHKPLFDMIFGPIAPATSDCAWRGGNLFPDIAVWEEAAVNAGFGDFIAAPRPGSVEDRTGEYIMLARVPDGAAMKSDRPAATTMDASDPASLLASLIDQMGSGRWTLESLTLTTGGSGASRWMWDGDLVRLVLDERNVIEARIAVRQRLCTAAWEGSVPVATGTLDQLLVRFLSASSIVDLTLDRVVRFADPKGALDLHVLPDGAVQAQQDE